MLITGVFVFVIILVLLAILLLVPGRSSTATMRPATWPTMNPRTAQINDDLRVLAEAYRDAETKRHREEVLAKVHAMTATLTGAETAAVATAAKK